LESIVNTISLVTSIAQALFRIAARRSWFCMVALVLVLQSPASAQSQAPDTILVVDDDSTDPTPDGLSWASAFPRLQDAIAQAALEDPPVHIWVAAGTYKPTTGSSRSATFQMDDDLEIYGGFIGSGNIDPAAFLARDSVANVTILSGEIGDLGEVDDNTWHIVTGNAVGNTAIIDGFTIRDAYAVDAPELIENDPETEGVGGGLVVLGGPGPSTNVVQAVFLRLRFTNNTALSGAGAFIRAGQTNAPQFRNCRWDNNSASSGGTAVLVAGNNSFGSNPVFYNCLFYDNTAGGTGSAMAAQHYASPKLVNATITQNVCESQTGSALKHGATEGGIPRPGGFDLQNTIVWNNSRTVEEALVADLLAQLAGEADLLHCDIQELGTPYPNPGTSGNIDDNPEFENPGGNNFHLACDSPCINAGLNTPVPDDSFDLSQEGSTTDDNPDLDLLKRIVGFVEMGVFEDQNLTCTADIDRDCDADVDDLIAVILQWGCTSPSCTADIEPVPCGDNDVDVDDLITVILNWGDCDTGCVPTGTGLGASPDSYEDCEEICESLEGEAWVQCMQACFYELCQNGHTEFCD
jgi:hypothetical protein